MNYWRRDMISKSSGHNPNYLAKIVEIKTVRNHPNADRLQLTTIDGNTVVLGMGTNIGDVGIYFPVECQINSGYLGNNNLFREKSLNNNPKATPGFFEENCRVRAVKLRGEKSMGFWMPISSLNHLLPLTEGIEFDWGVGEEFDTITIGNIDVLLVKKYIPKKTQTSGLGGSNKARQPKTSKIVDNQFRFHIDTAQLGKNIHRIQPTSVIQITKKLHGTSGISAKILCNRKANWLEKLTLWISSLFGVEGRVPPEYDYIYSSRKVIKNDDLNKKNNHYYDVDIWGIADQRLRPYITDGMTLYYEIVGYLPNGGFIQKDYDYGCNPGEFEIYIYRITVTTSDGKVHEYGSQQVKSWCEKVGLKSVPEVYYGRAIEWCPMQGNETVESYQQELLKFLQEAFLEKDCTMCKNKVPDEGIVLRIEDSQIDVYKLKSFAFMERETKELDKGEENIEDIQS